MSASVPLGTVIALIGITIVSMTWLSAWILSQQMIQLIRQLTEYLLQVQAGDCDRPMRGLIWSRDLVHELNRWSSLLVDILHAHYRIETDLRESEERYALALQGANDGIWDWDLRSNRMHYSSRWKTLLGYDEETIGASPEDWFSRIHPEDLLSVKVSLAAHLQGETPHFESEHRLLRGDGRYGWVLVRGLAVCDQQHQTNRIAGSLTDITARKQTEEQLRYEALHDSLTHLPNRTHLIQQLQQTLDTVRVHPQYLAAVLLLDL
ncbi:PAS domain-containing protein [Halomicronema hongdechloris]|uniref:PAS domain-containing protein n=1 Tax=Halomicronema hongdechloris TaxID=1209493 RepID=UPI0016510E11|nr:PAS domain-containing protein [Halomicronema hongdechloris]